MRHTVRDIVSFPPPPLSLIFTVEDNVASAVHQTCYTSFMAVISSVLFSSLRLICHFIVGQLTVWICANIRQVLNYYSSPDRVCKRFGKAPVLSVNYLH